MLRWTVQARDKGCVVAVLEGDITEHARFDMRLVGERVVLDLAGVRRINSEGLRQFLNFLSELVRASAVAAERCSSSFVMQLNMLPELSSRLTVRSVFVPFECPRCLHEQEILIDAPAGEEGAPPQRPTLPRMECKRCGTPMVCAEPEDRYFAFLSG